MDGTLRALRISEKVADGIPVPGLKSAINIALSIAEMADVSTHSFRRGAVNPSHSPSIA